MKVKSKLQTALAVVTCAVVFSSCKIQAPVFKGVENVQLERVGFKGVKFGGEAVFYNPNRIKCKLTDLAINVMLDKKHVGSIGEKSDVPINKKSDFKIPLGVTINPDGTIFENIVTIVELIRDKESVLCLEGDVKVKAYGITVPVRIKHEEKVKLSQMKSR